MSIRWRLAVLYALVTGLLMLLVAGATYAIHSRAQYDQVDALLADAANHSATEYTAATTAPGRARELADPVAPGVELRVFDAQGQTITASPDADAAPVVNPSQILAHPTSRAYDVVLASALPLIRVDQGRGQFAVVTDTQGNRWRVYVRMIGNGTGALEAAASLAQIDAAVARLRMLVPAVSLAGAIVALAAGWYLATCALRPVVSLTSTADEIARSRDLRRRVPVGVPRDELGQLAETFNRMLASLEQANRIQQRFVADASHELRAPLTVIQANLELLTQAETMPVDDRQVAVADARREVKRVGSLVGDLLVLARADSGQTLRRQPVELDRILVEVLREGRSLAHGQEIGIDALEPVVVQGDPDRLKQLVLILVDNAIKYTPSGGRVTLGLRRGEQCIEFTVRDTGVGIPRADLPHVFDRFYRADAARALDPAGTGLGLPIARWIAEQHGGTICLTSDEETGTTALVRLPLGSRTS